MSIVGRVSCTPKDRLACYNCCPYLQYLHSCNCNFLLPPCSLLPLPLPPFLSPTLCPLVLYAILCILVATLSNGTIYSNTNHTTNRVKFKSNTVNIAHINNTNPPGIKNILVSCDKKDMLLNPKCVMYTYVNPPVAYRPFANRQEK